MADRERSRWTLLLLRDDGVRIGRWGFPPALGAAAGAVVMALLVGLGALGASWWAERSERARIQALEGQIEELRAERASIGRLASRLDSVEEAYARLRRVMGGEAARSPGNVRLPPSPGRGSEVSGEDQGWGWPLARRGFVTKAFEAGGETGHPGLDVAVPRGSYVRAARPGRVTEAGEDSLYGRFVRLRHEDGTTSLYGHSSWLFAAPGDSVEAGEVIALSGNTGRSSAPHLHFEVSEEGRPVDPARLLRNVRDGQTSSPQKRREERP